MEQMKPWNAAGETLRSAVNESGRRRGARCCNGCETLLLQLHHSQTRLLEDPASLNLVRFQGVCLRGTWAVNYFWKRSKWWNCTAGCVVEEDAFREASEEVVGALQKTRVCDTLLITVRSAQRGRIRAGRCSASNVKPPRMQQPRRDGSSFSRHGTWRFSISFVSIFHQPLRTFHIPPRLVLSKGPGSSKLPRRGAQRGEDQRLRDVSSAGWRRLLHRGRPQTDPCQVDGARSSELWFVVFVQDQPVTLTGCVILPAVYL